MEATLEQRTQDDPIKVDENKLLEREWIEVNGLGAYSSNNLLNCNTRKYHGLLVVPAPSIAERQVLISKFDEYVLVNEHKYFLAHHYYEPGVKIPLQESEKVSFYFSQDLNPKWVYDFQDFKLTKEILMPWGEHTTLIKYSISGTPKANIKLFLRPLLAFRNFHSLSKENNSANFKTDHHDDYIKFKLYQDSHELFIQSSTPALYVDDTAWYKNFHLKLEKERGYDFVEDLASPGSFEIELGLQKNTIVSVSTLEQNIATLNTLWNFEIKRRSDFEKHSFGSALRDFTLTLFGFEKNDFAVKIKSAALKFIVKPDINSFSVIAGYPWFGEWGRDTMISLPGLLLQTGYEKIYLHTLRRFLDYKKDGLIPNIIGKSKEDSAYNSVDASLWLFWTIQQFFYADKDYALIRDHFWDDLKDIFTCYAASIPAHVKCHANGLIESGTEADSMSWMDACVDGKSVIPRYGFLVEINALWYNAVSFVAELATRFKDPIQERAEQIKLAIQDSFVATFYLPEYAYLADYVRTDEVCAQLRPNQIFALSMPYSLVSDAIADQMLNKIDNELLTPFGLRTLSPNDPAFCPKYQGDQKQRDKAYHNGTVWPWLLGAYGEAILKNTSQANLAQEKIKTLISNFEIHFKETGIGSISEIFDATEPYLARGCIAQAWSVAEIRRLMLLIN